MSKRDTKAWVRMFALDQEPGTYRVRCPQCDGGRTRERSMNITILVPEGIVYKCHRAACSGASGRIGGITVRKVPLDWPEQRSSKIKPYRGELHLPTIDDLQYFSDRFGIPPEKASAWVRRAVPHSVNLGAYILPIFDRYGRVRGHVARQPSWRGSPRPPLLQESNQPKARTWPCEASPTQSWYFPDVEDALSIVVIVEDQVSAMACASAGFIGLALLGTHLNLDRVREIQQENPEQVFLALDGDVEGLSIKLAQRWAVALPGFQLKLLHADLKDVPDVYLELMG